VRLTCGDSRSGRLCLRQATPTPTIEVSIIFTTSRATIITMDCYPNRLFPHCEYSLARSFSEASNDRSELYSILILTTPRARFELATSRLTVDRSTTELPRIMFVRVAYVTYHIIIMLNLASKLANFCLTLKSIESCRRVEYWDEGFSQYRCLL
jgi:hypothetical protein